jgi:putative endonuclease
MRHYFVYILTNKTDRVLYVGVTNNLSRRVREHKSKLVEGFTKKYSLNKLVLFESFNNPTDAIAAEKRIKGWTRERKIKLIDSKNPEWEDLFAILEQYESTGGLGYNKKDPSLRSG